MASQDWLEKDFYKTLGVDSSVSEKELTKKYHKLAHKYHPDSNPGDSTAEAKFKEISEAYSVLSDKDQRAEYDQIRAMGAGGARFTAGGSGFEDIFGGFGNRGGFQSENIHFGGQGAGFEDIFNMFGGGFTGARGPQKGSDISASITVDFLTALNGDTVTINTGTKTVKVRVPAGVDNGKKIRVRGKGNPGAPGASAGDLLLTVNVRKHPVFERDGKNLRVKLPVTFTEATLGATVEVPTVTGERVKLKIAAGTPSGRMLRVKGRGVQTAAGVGDLLAEVQIVVPQRLDKKQQKALKAFAELETDADPRADLFARTASA